MAGEVADLPEPRNADGEIRGVGVEIEFSGLDVQHATRVVASALDGRVEQVDPRRTHIHAAAGRFTVELDTRWAHPDFIAEHASDLPPEARDSVSRNVSDLAGAVLDNVFPVELITPPIPYVELGMLRGVCDRLAQAGALGTEHSAFSGFGVHFNVEAARLEIGHVLSVMRAYLLRDFDLRRQSRIALIRQMQSYIEPFPEAYKRHVLDPGYDPDMDRFMDDHMRFNPTRDMELDLLPLFAFIDEDLVKRRLPDEKNSPRPTFHWRLPNCRIDEPGWSPLQDWDRWVSVEQLAADPDRLVEGARVYLREGPGSEFSARMRRIMDYLRSE